MSDSVRQSIVLYMKERVPDYVVVCSSFTDHIVMLSDAVRSFTSITISRLLNGEAACGGLWHIVYTITEAGFDPISMLDTLTERRSSVNSKSPKTGSSSRYYWPEHWLKYPTRQHLISSLGSRGRS